MTETKSHRDLEKEVGSWGFLSVFTWTDSANSYYPPHKHACLTTHLILKGTFTIAYPLEKDTEKKTYGVGDRIDVESGRVHEVWIGPDEPCTYVIGE